MPAFTWFDLPCFHPLAATSARNASQGCGKEASMVSLDQYAPDLPEVDWERIRDSVLAIVTQVQESLPYPAAAVLNAVAHHVDWCVNVAGFDDDALTLFRRDVIGAGVAVMATERSSTMGRRRSILLRVGEALGSIPTVAPLPTLAAASPSAPYSPEEIAGLIRWADTQRDRHGASARALLALGLGAGLPTRDICAVRSGDVAPDGSWIQVAGDKTRTVPVAPDWTDELAELANDADNADATLFRPGVARSKNIVTVFVARAIGSERGPSSQRMRSTWLVRQLATGMPMQDLLAAAGLESMDALVRYERFLPPASLPAPSGTTQ